MSAQFNPAEARAAAAAEGLTLLRSENTTGFKGVSRDDTRSKPFMASLRHDGRTQNLGYFATAEDSLSRSLGTSVTPTW